MYAAMYTVPLTHYLILAPMVLVPLAIILVVAYRDSRTSTMLDHTRYTPNPTLVRTLPNTKPYDWADPIEQMDYDVLMFDCPADPTHKEESK